MPSPRKTAAALRIKDAQLTRSRRETPYNITYYPGADSKVKTKTWGNSRSKPHRLYDLPAFIEYYPNGVIKEKGYFIKGDYHRTKDKPAKITYSTKGKITGQYWYVGGKSHREGGPADIIYKSNSKSVSRARFSLDGRTVTEKTVLMKEARKKLPVVSAALIHKLPVELIGEILKTLYKKRSPKSTGGNMVTKMVPVPTRSLTGHRTGTKYVEKQLYVKKTKGK